MTWWVKVGVIALGGALGALLRTGVGEAAVAIGWRSAAGTFAANMFGCLGMGLARGAVQAWDVGSPELRALVFAGFLGAFTTFSTFEADTFSLWQQGDRILAVGYVGASVLGGLGMFGVGWWLTTRGA